MCDRRFRSNILHQKCSQCPTTLTAIFGGSCRGWRENTDFDQSRFISANFGQIQFWPIQFWPAQLLALTTFFINPFCALPLPFCSFLGRRGFTRQPENSKRAHFRAPGGHFGSSHFSSCCSRAESRFRFVTFWGMVRRGWHTESKQWVQVLRSPRPPAAKWPRVQRQNPSNGPDSSRGGLPNTGVRPQTKVTDRSLRRNPEENCAAAQRR